MKTSLNLLGILAASVIVASDGVVSQGKPAEAAVPCRNAYSQDFSWRQLNRTGRVLINNQRSSPVQITLIHPDSASQFSNWTIAASNRTFLVYNNQTLYVGDDWGIQLDGGCVFYVGEVGIYNSQTYEITLSGSNQVSLSGLVSPYSPQRPQPSPQRPQPRNTLPPETSAEVRNQNYVDMGGGWAGAQATLYRNGLLVIASRAVSNARTSGTRGRVFVVGVDRRGRSLFVSESFDIPTACGRLDTCSSDRSQNFQQRISPDLAMYVARLDVYPEDRGGGRSAREALRVTITESCAAYDDLPVAARAAIAYQTGFPGCNPLR
jgi:hypothetical protein